MGARVFLVGDRGVQVLAVTLDRVEEVVDTIAGESAAALGRHLVTVGGEHMQVLDGLPFGVSPVSSVSPASVRP